MPHALPGQAPIVVLAPPTCYDLMNPTTTIPFTIPDSNPTHKSLRPSYVAIPLYAMIPLPTPQVQALPPHPTLSPHLLNPVFRDVIERTVEHLILGATALVWLFSAFAEAAYQKDLTTVQDDSEQLSGCDSFDLDSLPPVSMEDDLLRMDMTELKSIPSSELYLGETKLVTPRIRTVHLTSNLPRSSLLSRSSSIATTLTSPRESFLPSEDLTSLLQMPDDELYLNPEYLDGPATTPPWPFNSLAVPPSTSLLT